MKDTLSTAQPVGMQLSTRTARLMAVTAVRRVASQSLVVPSLNPTTPIK